MKRLLYLLPLLFFACSDPPRPQKKTMTKDEAKRLSDEINKWDVQRENDEINQYIKAHNYDMHESPSGLRYMLLKEGKGPCAQVGQTVKVMYRIYLLDGTLCYSSEKDGAKDVIVGKDNVETGIHEGLQLMNPGSEMRFILPSHLAHGFTGDQSKIPPLTSVVYEVQMLSVK